MILIEYAGPIARVTLNRPANRNALDAETIAELHTALDSLSREEHLRVLVLTGAGDRAFCSGADLAALATHPDARRAAARQFARLAVRIAGFARPVIARVNGPCVAGGMALFLAADLAVCHDGCHFALPEGNVGMWPMVVGPLLRRVVGHRVALDLALTGRRVEAEEAFALGLVNRVVPADLLDTTVDALAERVARMSPSAVRMGRTAWLRAEALPLEAAVDQLADRLGDLMETEDAAEGFLAFLQKRDPVWKDR